MLRMRGASTVCLNFARARDFIGAAERRAQENMPNSTVELTLPNSTDIRTWFSNVEQHATEGVNKILIGNKCDWEEKRVVSTQQGQQLAQELGIPFMEVSAKSNINVEKAFFSLATDIKKRIVDTQQPQAQQQQGGVNVGGAGGIGGSGIGKNCC